MQDTVTAGSFRGRQINGLRELADMLVLCPDLAVPSLQVVASSAEEVYRAAATQGAEVTVSDSGIVRTLVRYDAVTVDVFHVTEESMADYYARQSYAAVVQP